MSLSLAISRIILDFFFFNDTATTEIYTLSLHDALPISPELRRFLLRLAQSPLLSPIFRGGRSEEHTSELQSRPHLVCRLLLEKKKQTRIRSTAPKVWLIAPNH